MDKAKYWLLDTAIELKLAIRMLLSPDLEIALNRPTHGLDHRQLLETLRQLFEQGYLAAWKWNTGVEDSNGFIPSLQQIEDELGARDRALEDGAILYGLTADGGAAWESLSLPRWNRYISATFGTDPDEGEVIAQKRKTVESYLALLRQTSTWIQSIDRETMEWEVLEPWQATYWKTLPTGYRLTFQIRPYPEDADQPVIPDDAWEELFQMQKWYTSYLDIRKT